MSQTEFMHRKFKVQEAFSRYMKDVYMLSKGRELNLLEKQSLKQYLRSIKVLKEATVLDIARCAMAFGRNLSGKPLEIWQAIPVVIGRRVSQPSQIDLEYAQILLEYASALQTHKFNIRDLILKFVLTQRLSPVSPYFESHLQNVIDETVGRIRKFKDATRW